MDNIKIYLDKIIKVMKNDYPLFKNMKSYGFYDQLSEDELNYVLSNIFQQPVIIEGNTIYDQNNNRIYYETSDGYWYKYEYDENGNIIYYETYNGYWYKFEYDNNGNIIYREDSNGEIINNR